MIRATTAMPPTSRAAPPRNVEGVSSFWDPDMVVPALALLCLRGKGSLSGLMMWEGLEKGCCRYGDVNAEPKSLHSA
jgi:hypothetical protein